MDAKQLILNKYEKYLPSVAPAADDPMMIELHGQIGFRYFDRVSGMTVSFIRFLSEHEVNDLVRFGIQMPEALTQKERGEYDQMVLLRQLDAAVFNSKRGRIYRNLSDLQKAD